MPKLNCVVLLLVSAAALAASHPVVPGAAGAQQQAGGSVADIVQRANEAYDKMNFAEALALYQEVLRTAPRDYVSENETRIHRALGACYAQLKRYQEAVAEFTRANSIHEEAENFAWLGLVYDSLRDYSSGEQNWQKAVDQDSDNPEFNAGLAYAASHLGNFDAAQRAIERSRQRAATEETRQSLRQSQMIVFLGRGRYDEASQLGNREKRIYVEGEDVPGGVRLGDVYRGGPARLAGLERGDIIVSINGDPVAGNAGLVAALDRQQFGAAVPLRINRNGTALERKVIVGVPPNLPVLTAAANSGEIASDRVAPPADRSALILNRVVVKPASVAPGEPFTVEVSYTTTSKGTVGFTASIHAGGQKLFESRPRSFEAAGNAPELITSKITAADQPGNYTIRVHLAFGAVNADAEATLTVTPKK